MSQIVFPYLVRCLKIGAMFCPLCHTYTSLREVGESTPTHDGRPYCEMCHTAQMLAPLHQIEYFKALQDLEARILGHRTPIPGTVVSTGHGHPAVFKRQRGRKHPRVETLEGWDKADQVQFEADYAEYAFRRDIDRPHK